MSWIGQEIGTPRAWGPDGATADHPCAPEARILVGAPGVPGDNLPGKLMPEQMQQAPDGIHLPPLGALSAGQRLRLLGFQTLNPHWDGLAVLPGVRETLWVTLSAGEAIHLRASATPRLAKALGCAEEKPQGLDEAMARADALPFELAEAAPAQALGLLLGAEMAAAKSLWLGQQAVLVGQVPLSRAYLAALQGLYVPVTETAEDALLREGFRALARKFLPAA
ncbi:2-dehydro-3-deoxygalactonokinase [Pseudooceanicola sp. 200-1SW]|uniref:2-dehydro-3-deoxygalactonokinase n=1 Tax=Pseudooceanicola sp. 200-1SW TaxID=3425949 RepID=UPI003D7FE14F